MKRTVVLLMLAVFLVVGLFFLKNIQTPSLVDLGPTLTMEQNIAILMAEVRKCEPDGEWKCLSIPDMNFEKNEIRYVVYKHLLRDSWGFGMVARGANITYGWDVTRETHFVSFGWMGFPITAEEFEKNFWEFIEIICQKGDFSEAGRFDPDYFSRVRT